MRKTQKHGTRSVQDIMMRTMRTDPAHPDLSKGLPVDGSAPGTRADRILIERAVFLKACREDRADVMRASYTTRSAISHPDRVAHYFDDFVEALPASRIASLAKASVTAIQKSAHGTPPYLTVKDVPAWPQLFTMAERPLTREERKIFELPDSAAFLSGILVVPVPVRHPESMTAMRGILPVYMFLQRHTTVPILRFINPLIPDYKFTNPIQASTLRLVRYWLAGRYEVYSERVMRGTLLSCDQLCPNTGFTNDMVVLYPKAAGSPPPIRDGDLEIGRVLRIPDGVTLYRALGTHAYSWQEGDSWARTWSVDTALSLTERITPVRIPIPDHWRRRAETGAVLIDTSYALRQDNDRPVIAVTVPTGLELIDGWHRLYRRLADGHTDINCLILSAEQEREVRICDWAP